jgi:iron complex outermembrane receptor protein
VWTPTSRQTIWLAASQAVRQPSRQDTDIQLDETIIPLPAGASGVLQFDGNKNIQPEQLRDYEVGYRAQLTKRLSLSLATFRSYYRHLETSEPETPYFVGTAASSYLVLPYLLTGTAGARTYGGEIFATWNVTSRWRLSPGYSLLHMTFVQDPFDQNSSVTAVSGGAPGHQIQLRSTFGLLPNLDWDTSLYSIGRVNDEQIPGYTRLDMQVRWRVLKAVEFSIVGQNLLTARHLEFGDSYGVGHTEVSRSALGKFTWRF